MLEKQHIQLLKDFNNIVEIIKKNDVKNDLYMMQ